MTKYAMWDDLDPEDLQFIENNALCPFCKEGQLMGGPRGGACQNFKCEKCGEKVNLMAPEAGLSWGQYIGREAP